MRHVISEIAKKLEPLYEAWPNSKSYGLAKLVQRDEQQLPMDTEGNYFGVDDESPLISYHRCDTVTTSTLIRQGFGNDLGQLQNNYQVIMIIYFDPKRINLWADQLAHYIQANFPDGFTGKDIIHFIRLTGIILNSRVVFGQEYQGTDVQIPPEKSIFQINYTIESRFDKACFKNCPC